MKCMYVTVLHVDAYMGLRKYAKNTKTIDAELPWLFVDIHCNINIEVKSLLSLYKV